MDTNSILASIVLRGQPFGVFTALAHGKLCQMRALSKLHLIEALHERFTTVHTCRIKRSTSTFE